MGPCLLYALIVGAVIIGALALRIWDPSPVARLRSLVFDIYQKIEPRKFDPALPLRIVDIDEESARHNEFLSKCRARDWDAADMLRRECDRMNGSSLQRLYALCRERIEFFRHNPPPLDWDGTAEALAK